MARTRVLLPATSLRLHGWDVKVALSLPPGKERGLSRSRIGPFAEVRHRLTATLKVRQDAGTVAPMLLSMAERRRIQVTSIEIG